jgi:hypothetical protein
MEQPEWDRQNKTARTAKIRQPGQDTKERTAEKTARTGQLDRTVRTGHPGQGKQTGETEQDC